MVPFVDLKPQHQQIKVELLDAFSKVLDGGIFSGGYWIEEFENQFANYCNAKHAVAVNNGTSALFLALKVLGIGEGDEVIVPTNSFIATAFSVSHTGAIPVFVDCLPDTWQIDYNDIAKKITTKTKAVIGVHLYGQPFDFDEVKKVIAGKGIYLIEDAAQAHGALYKGQKVGSLGDMACFSFYPTKNLGACGEAGAVVTNNSDLDFKLRSLRNYGSREKYIHQELGYNFKLGNLEAASLIVKLKYLDEWNLVRQQTFKEYVNNCQNKSIKFQYQPEFVQSVFHLIVVQVDNRDEYKLNLYKKGIESAIHYPIPCHLQKAYKYLGYKKGDFVVSEKLAETCLSLPSSIDSNILNII